MQIGPTPIQFNVSASSHKQPDTTMAKQYFKALLTWKKDVLMATIANTDSNPNNDTEILLQSVGPVNPADPATIMAVEYEDRRYEHGLELALGFLNRHSDILEKTSTLSANA